MGSDDAIFHGEYSAGTKTEAVPKQRPSPDAADSMGRSPRRPPTATSSPHIADSIPEIDIEDVRYGTAKPERVFIRAKVLYDQD